MLPLNFEGNYIIRNLSNQLAAYGYIYYVSLTTGEPYAIKYIQSALAIFGIILTIFALSIHICAICFARKYLYKTGYLRLNSSSVNDQITKSKSWINFKRNYEKCFARIKGCYSKCSKISCLCTTKFEVETKFEEANTSQNFTLVDVSQHIPLDHKQIQPVLTGFPGISILKPLRGVDRNLEVNLTSYFHIEYPKYELLFCVADKSDASCEIVRKLQSIHPDIPSRLIVADNNIGVNPKITNLQAGYEAAQYEFLLISDSGIWMRPDTLSDMVSIMLNDEQTGMVHQMPFLTPYFDAIAHSAPSETKTFPPYVSPDRPPFSWIVQLLFFGCWHAKMYLSAAALGINCTTGMSCLLRKSVLLPLDGFKAFSCYLAEDYFLSKYCADRGWKIKLSRQPAWQNSPSQSISQFRARIGRWAHLRLHMVVIAYLMEPLSRFFPNAIFGALSFAYLLPDWIDPGVYMLCYFLIWFLLDYYLLLYIYPSCLPLCISKSEFLIGWIYSEVTALPFYLRVFFQKHVQWRDKLFRVHWGGVTEEIPLAVRPRLEESGSCSESISKE